MAKAPQIVLENVCYVLLGSTSSSSYLLTWVHIANTEKLKKNLPLYLFERGQVLLKYLFNSATHTMRMSYNEQHCNV
jgi:hypothetical protein